MPDENNDRICTFDPLVEFMAHYADAKSVKKEASAYEGLSLEDKLKQRIVDGDKIGLDTDLSAALKSYAALEIINTILLDGMKTVGELFGSGEMQLPFVLQSAETMKAAVKYLEPFMEKNEVNTSKGKMVLATVKGDVHDIGKNLVDIILTNNGYTVYNLGIKVGLEQMLEEFTRQRADAIGMSGLLVKSTAIMKENLEVMQQRGLEVPVILGGAALTKKFVEKDLREIYAGQLSYAQDAFDGLHFMEKLKGAAGGNIAQEEKRPLTRDEMLKEMAASRAELLATLEGINENEYSLPQTFNQWSLRDVLVHMIGWERLASERIHIIKSGKLPEPIAESEADAWNARYVASSPLTDARKIVAELNSARSELVELLSKVNDEEFLRSAEIPPMQVWLPYFSFAHERHHLKKIKEWLEEREQELDTATGEESKMALAKRELPWLNGTPVALQTSQRPEQTRVARSNEIPTPPFWGVDIREQFILDKVWEYLNEVALFRGQWQLKRGRLSPKDHQKLIDEVARPKLNELKLLCKQQRVLKPQAVYGYFPCWSEGDDVVVLKPESYSDIALLEKWDVNDVAVKHLVEYKRFTFPRQPSGRRLCIADFFLSKEEAAQRGRVDVVAFSAVTVGRKASTYTAELFSTNQYADYLYLHGLSVETAEALAEYLHKVVRAELGIGGADAENMQRLFSQGYQGSRYSFGYPACPELADQVKLFELLRPERIDITLTEEYHLEPEQSTTAIICHHPEARYFGIK